jgi:hypothetical protein
VTWTIHIRRNDTHFEHVAQELSSAIAVACLLLRDGIDVDAITGPDGFYLDNDAIRPLCGETGKLSPIGRRTPSGP